MARCHSVLTLLFCRFVVFAEEQKKEEQEEEEEPLAGKDDEERRIAEMGRPMLGDHVKLEVIIEESYEFKVSSRTLSRLAPAQTHLSRLVLRGKLKKKRSHRGERLNIFFAGFNEAYDKLSEQILLFCQPLTHGLRLVSKDSQTHIKGTKSPPAHIIIHSQTFKPHTGNNCVVIMCTSFPCSTSPTQTLKTSVNVITNQVVCVHVQPYTLMHPPTGSLQADA